MGISENMLGTTVRDQVRCVQKDGRSAPVVDARPCAQGDGHRDPAASVDSCTQVGHDDSSGHALKHEQDDGCSTLAAEISHRARGGDVSTRVEAMRLEHNRPYNRRRLQPSSGVRRRRIDCPKKVVVSGGVHIEQPDSLACTGVVAAAARPVLPELNVTRCSLNVRNMNVTRCRRRLDSGGSVV